MAVRVRVTDANTAKVWRENSDDGRLFVLALRTGSKVDQTQHMQYALELAQKYQHLLPEGLHNLGAGIQNIMSKMNQAGGGQNLVISKEFKAGIITDALVSDEASNPNDAKITSITVSYLDVWGKRVEDKIGEKQVGEEFAKRYSIPGWRKLKVTAKAAQTGETRDLATEIENISNKGNIDLTTLTNLAQTIKTTNTNNNQNPALGDLLKLHGLLEVIADFRGEWKGLRNKRSQNAKVKLKLEILQDGVIIKEKEIEADGEVSGDLEG